MRRNSYLLCARISGFLLPLSSRMYYNLSDIESGNDVSFIFQSHLVQHINWLYTGQEKATTLY